MLSPNERSLYTNALTPPPGMELDTAIGATFSMDPTVLLSVPVHLSLLVHERGSSLDDGIAILESLRRYSERITVYGQTGRIQVPTPGHALYGLLETMIVEVTAPRGGVFHPKFWLLRFVSIDAPESSFLRFMVLSRNLTADRSWDLSVVLEGVPTGKLVGNNRLMGEFINALPTFATTPVSEQQRQQAASLSDEFRRTPFELPSGYDSLTFHIPGWKHTRLSTPAAKRCAVISPFCTENVLKDLAKSVEHSEVLISRPETLRGLSKSTRAAYARVLVLNEAAESEDGEAIDAQEAHDTHGLHAKALIFEHGRDTHLFVGSANATNAGMLNAINLEVMLELTGRTSKVGGIDTLMGDTGLGELVMDFIPPAESVQEDLAIVAALAAQEFMRNQISAAKARVRCLGNIEGDRWHLQLVGSFGTVISGITVQTWPITLDESHAVSLFGENANGESITELGQFAASSLTGMLAFEVRSPILKNTLRFVRNLPVEGMPEHRNSEIIQTVIRNRDGFLRYLLLLLSDFEVGNDAITGSLIAGGQRMAWNSSGFTEVPLLEELVRAYNRHPEKLDSVKHLVERLTHSESGREIVPESFLELWTVFQKAMEGRHDP